MTLTNHTINVMLGMFLIFLVLLLAISVFKSTKTKQPPLREPKQSPQPKAKSKQRHEEVIDSLDWMLQNQIITPTEYNQLITKSLPFLG